jgi:competence protein ComEA
VVDVCHGKAHPKWAEQGAAIDRSSTGGRSPAEGVAAPGPAGRIGHTEWRAPTGRRGAMVGAVAVVVALMAGWLWWGQPSAEVAAGGAESPSASLTAVPGTAAPTSHGTIVVHVSGAVASPGVVSLPAGARVADAVAAAGGVDRSGDVTAINLAAPLADGDQVVVPSTAGPTGTAGAAAGAGSATAGGAAGAGTDGRVAVNRAGPAELEALPGVGPVIAQRIVAHRDANGPFQVVEDLLDVPGIGEATLAGFRDLVVVP